MGIIIQGMHFLIIPQSSWKKNTMDTTGIVLTDLHILT